MEEFTLIANSGIQLFAARLRINVQDRAKIWFHEWYDTSSGQWKLNLVREIMYDDTSYYYDKNELLDNGYDDTSTEITPDDLTNYGIKPLATDDSQAKAGKLFKMSFGDRNNSISCFENKWLPMPYFLKKTETKFKFTPMNWARVKLIPKNDVQGVKEYDVILAFDTRADYKSNEYNEYPVFPDQYSQEMNFELCDDEFLLMDFCSKGEKWSYINDYIFKLVHPSLSSESKIKGADTLKMSYMASYVFLMKYIADKKLFPKVRLYKDRGVEVSRVDMVLDIGNYRTTALLIEDNSNFNQIRPLSLIDYTDMIKDADAKPYINSYNEPFDMRLAFRQVDFGRFGIKDSKQFVYPSFIRLGKEANKLIHNACNMGMEEEVLSTYSSPKRYLWDSQPNKNEWEFLVLPGEESQEHILNIRGISSYLTSDGRVDVTGKKGGRTSRYSRRSLMTFAFMEMLVQATTLVNSDSYRTERGWKAVPRQIKRIIVTCPTAMSKIEREALVKCVKDAVTLLNKFRYSDDNVPGIDVIPSPDSKKDSEPSWYYDEATCAQLVYIYSEIGYKYKGACNEFFNLYGKAVNGSSQNTLTVGSLDIGAGTTDLMICEYSYMNGVRTDISADPKFYDSFYFAGDDILKALVKNVMLSDDKHSAFRKSLMDLNLKEYRQKIKNFFGPDYSGQTIADRMARKNFNIQYSVPLMQYYLQLAANDSKSCRVTYEDVFSETPPNEAVKSDFKRKMGIDITTLAWDYDKDFVEDLISKEFDPLLKKIAAIFYAYSCDVILLSGRPSSLPAIRNIFLKYYPVSPNKLIALNNYYVGDWYPFSSNTGYITNPKTIVAMGGVIAYYASEYSNLDKFTINLEKLKQNLKSTVNYIEASRDSRPIEYMMTPEKSQGDLVITKIPSYLNVRQLGLDTYPSRTLYCIDFNYTKIMDRLRSRAYDMGESPSDAAIKGMADDEVDSLKVKMPFKINIFRDPDDKEKLSIGSIEDKNGNDVPEGNVEIHIQSLGAGNQYWLDSGAFEF